MRGVEVGGMNVVDDCEDSLATQAPDRLLLVLNRTSLRLAPIHPNRIAHGKQLVPPEDVSAEVEKCKSNGDDSRPSEMNQVI